MTIRQVPMTEEQYEEYQAWLNRPRCPNEGQMCNCTGACQPRPGAMSSWPSKEVLNVLNKTVPPGLREAGIQHDGDPS